jgi:hypothetical protein
VARGGSITFTFSANSGYHVSSVTIDGIPISSADISKGSYTFANAMMNHSIAVSSSSGVQRTDISLHVDVSDGGYVEYSLDGGKTFTRYTETVENIPEGSDIVLRAYANDGYEFGKWMPSGTTSYELTLGKAGGPMDVSVVFESQSSPSGSSDNSWMWWVLGIIVLLIIIGLILWFLLFYRRYYDVIKVSPENVTIVGDNRVHRKNEYRFTVQGSHSGKISYRVGKDENIPWKTITPNDNGEYIIPKGEITDNVTVRTD